MLPFGLRTGVGFFIGTLLITMVWWLPKCVVAPESAMLFSESGGLKVKQCSNLRLDFLSSPPRQLLLPLRFLRGGFGFPFHLPS